MKSIILSILLIYISCAKPFHFHKLNNYFKVRSLSDIQQDAINLIKNTSSIHTSYEKNLQNEKISRIYLMNKEELEEFIEDTLKTFNLSYETYISMLNVILPLPYDVDSNLSSFEIYISNRNINDLKEDYMKLITFVYKYELSDIERQTLIKMVNNYDKTRFEHEMRNTLKEREDLKQFEHFSKVVGIPCESNEESVRFMG
jgi:hypothetical protein